MQELKSFSWQGTKKGRWTSDRWSQDENTRKLKDSTTPANALLTGPRQLDPTKQFKLVAVDLDKKDNWKEVVETYKALELPESLTVKTPSGGYHILFWVPKGIPAQNINDDRHCKNFELKGDGNNITAPGSVFDCGATYKIVRDIPIAYLYPNEAYSLCKYKAAPKPIFERYGEPDRYDVENHAKWLDRHARRNPRGWEIHCPKHEDKRRSAVLFNSGWIYCSGCGYKEMVVKKEVEWHN